ncbi:DUF6265 family protein [Luteimonas saliphila]|uniref:DUF6265 family protein n=1 Tax=Luteimonas saliphila TaxID=2804919 RepID=UPI00192E08FE|nr:DUF6265 family protein [Luteimonas saliphila]
MRTILLLACILLASLVPPSAVANTDARIEALGWLLGQWRRTGLPEGRTGHERWEPAGSGLAGVGALQRDGATVFEEQLRIEADGREVFYVADVPGNAAPVRFRLVEQSESAVAFENPGHDFPQRIAYRRDGERLRATISGDGREASFAFERAAPPGADPHDPTTRPAMQHMINWFEIPVADFDRALRFYGAVLDAPLEAMDMDGVRMGMFPSDGRNVSGAIVHGEDYVPGTTGALVYLSGGGDLAPALARVAAAGGKVIVPKTQISPEFGYFALFLDSEGNRVGLHSPN